MSTPRACDTFWQKGYEWAEEACTGIATTSRDDSDGWLPRKRFCASCACAFDHWLDNYDGPEPDGEAFRGGEAAAYEAEQMTKIQRELK